MSHYLILTKSGLATLKIRYYIYGIIPIRLYIYIYTVGNMWIVLYGVVSSE
jgi:hypothetical protein